MTTVLFFNLYAEMGGAENALLHLLGGLDRTRFRPFVAVASDGPLVRRLAEADVACRVMPFPARSLWHVLVPATFARYLSAARALSLLVSEERVDIVHTGDVLCLLIARLAGLRTPLVYQMNYAGGSARRGLLRLLAPGLVTRVLAFSEAQKRALERAAPELGRRCDVVPVGIPTPAPSLGREALRRELGLAADVPFAAMFGRFDPIKGHATFLEAAARVHARRPEARFAIVGGALNADVLPHVSRVRARVVGLRAELGLTDVVRIAGFVPDPAAWMAACDVVVCPSVNEPFGLVVVEAMRLGVCVLVSDSGGPAEIVEHEKGGLQFRTGDPEALAQGLLRLLDDPGLRARLAESGRQRATMLYDRASFSRSVESLYERLA